MMSKSLEVQQLQYRVLGESTMDNPLLPTKLRTESTTIIGAINELKDKIDVAYNSIEVFNITLRQTLGNITGEDFVHWVQVYEQHKNLTHYVCDLANRVTILETSIGAFKSKVRQHLEFDGTNIFTIDKIPTEHQVLIFVNGIEYDEDDDFIVDRSKGVIQWVNESVILSDNDELDIEYYIEGNQPVSFNVEVLEFTDGMSFTIENTPNETQVKMSINGIEYDEDDDFIVDRSTKIITWMNESYMVKHDDEILVHYAANSTKVDGNLIKEIPSTITGSVDEFILSETPNDKKVLLSVNGITYQESEFINIDRDNKLLKWVGPFDIESSDELDVTYWV